MASTQGTDASRASLYNQYEELCASMPKSFTKRIDTSIRDMLARLDSYRSAPLVLFYLPFHEEIDTATFMQDALDDGKRIALPVVDNITSTMTWYEIDETTRYERGARGMAAAPENAKPLGTIDFLGSVCVVPGLVFDAEGYRVGYGAGYYDEFLPFYPGEKIGIVRSVQVSSNPLPREEHDMPVDVLVTEGSIWRCRRI